MTDTETPTAKTPSKPKAAAISTLRFVLKTVQENPNISADEVSEITGFAVSSIAFALGKLVKEGSIYSPDRRATRSAPRRYTAHAPSDLSVARKKLAEAYDMLAQQCAGEPNTAELEELRAFKKMAASRYPDLVAKPIEELVREEISRQFPEYAAAAAAGELDGTLLAASIRTRIEAEA